MLRALAEVLDAGEVGTVARVAEAVGAHPNGVRRHLAALEDESLAASTGPSGGGRGRPSLGYDVTPAGRAALAAAAAPISAEYLAMAEAFADDLADRDTEPALHARAIGRSWGRRLAAGPTRATPAQGRQRAAVAPTPQATPAGDRVITLLDGLGFSPLRRPDGDVALRTCPLLEAARAHPEVLCQMHLGLVQGAFAAYDGAGEGGELRAFDEPGACVLRLPAPPVGRSA